MSTPAELKRLARAGQADELEAAWLEVLGDPPPAAAMLPVVRALPRPLRGAAPSLLTLLLEAYQGADRHEDVLPVVRALLPLTGRLAELRESALAALAALHAGEEWLAPFLDISGLGDEARDPVDAFASFDRLLGLLPGRVVFHRSGWGEGLVTEIDVSRGHLKVRFREGGLVREMPFTSALDVLDPLPPHDLRARLLVDLEGLKADAEDRPEALVRAVAAVHRGRTGAKEIKTWLAGTVVEERRWAGWWRKAKAAAAKDPHLSVDNPARPVFVLRDDPLSPAEELAEAVSRADGLPGVVEVVRGPLGMDPDAAILAALVQHLRAALEACPADRHPAAQAEAAWLLVRAGAMEPDEQARRLDALVTPASRFADLVADLPGPARRDVLDAFVAARPQLWSDEVVADLDRLPATLIDAAARRLVDAGRGDALGRRFHILLISPSRQPDTVLRLGRVFADGLLDGVEGAPTRDEVVMGLLSLAETQAPRAARGDKQAKAVVRELIDVLRRRKGGLLRPFVEHAPRSRLEAVMHLLGRCRGMPDEIDAEARRLIDARFPDLVPREEVPFWESGGIYCSRAGLARRREEHRVLIEVKIPENSETIGRAASYGDLSENFEWAAAIEQQRQLTSRAAVMEAELKVAAAIEDQEVPDGVVAPGTRVTYLEGGERKTIRILGPWDVADGVVSYLAPVAAGMLGCRVGETATLELPGGAIEVAIEAIEPALARA